MKKIDKKNIYKPNLVILKKLISDAGGINNFARSLQKISKEGTSLSSIRSVVFTKRMPPYLALIIEKYSNNEVTRKQLLPNLF